MKDAFQELNADELDTVCGGMKTDPNYVRKDVIDARGGYFTVLGITFTFDVTGSLSGQA